MRILIVLPHLRTGGTGRQTICLANGLAKLERVEVCLFILSKEGALSEILPPETQNQIVYSELAGQPRYSKWRIKPVSRIVSIVKAAKKFKPDVIYVRSKPFSSIVAGKMLGIPVVIGEINNPAEGLKGKKTAVSRWLTFFLRRTNRKFASKIVANSVGLANESKKFWKLGKKPSVIHNGLDMEFIDQKSREKIKHPWLDNKDLPLIVSVGRIVPQKGFDHLVEAVSIVNRERKIRLIIVGRIDERGIRDRLWNQIERLKLEDSVALVGDQSNPYPFMKAADVYVSSSFYEGFSNSLLEALALRLPIVSTNHDFGADEIIENEQSGLLVPVADPEAMAEAVLRILRDGELSEKLAQNAYKRAWTFTLEKTVSEYEKIFREVTVL